MNLRVLGWAIALVVGVGLFLSACHVPHANLGTLTSMGKVTPSSGGVKILRGGAAIAATHGVELEAGDVVETDAQSTAVIDFVDGSATLMPNTKVTVGSIWTWFGKVFFSGPVDNDTEYTSMSVDGTEYVAEVEQDRLVVTVLTGRVRVSSKTGAFAEVTATARERLEVTSLRTAGSAPPTKRTITQDELNSLVEQLNAAQQAQSRVVPDVTGLAEAQATQKLSALGFTPKSEKHPAQADQIGKVFSQSPAPGTRGTQVLLSVGARAVHVPDVRGLTLEQVAAQLPSGLRIGRQAFEFTGKQPLDQITRQSPAPGTAVVEGTSIDVVVEARVMPDLRGKTIEQAQAELRRLGVKVLTRERPDAAHAPGTILAQSPVPGTRLDLKPPVELAVATRPQASTDPNGTPSEPTAPVATPTTATTVGVQPPPAPRLVVAPRSLDFGSVEPQTPKSLELTLENRGNAPLSVKLVDVSPTESPFRAPLTTACSQLVAGATCRLTVTYEPLYPGAHEVTLRIVSNAPGGDVTVAVTGTAAFSGPTGPAQ